MTRLHVLLEPLQNTPLQIHFYENMTSVDTDTNGPTEFVLIVRIHCDTFGAHRFLSGR